MRKRSRSCELSSPISSLNHPDEATTAASPLDETQFPLITSLGHELVKRDHDADFEFGLDLLVAAVGDLRAVGNLGSELTLDN